MPPVPAEDAGQAHLLLRLRVADGARGRNYCQQPACLGVLQPCIDSAWPCFKTSEESGKRLPLAAVWLVFIWPLLPPASETPQGVFCGDCLFMRYGEHVDEVNANPGALLQSMRFISRPVEVPPFV